MMTKRKRKERRQIYITDLYTDKFTSTDFNVKLFWDTIESEYYNYFVYPIENCFKY